jgi:hypothetical protein
LARKPIRRKTSILSRIKTRPKRRSVSKSRNSVGRRIRIISLALVSVFATTIALAGFSLYKFANAPYSSAGQVDFTETDGVWNESGVNLIFMEIEDIRDPNSDVLQMSLVKFDIATKRYYIYSLPLDSEIEYALNYGTGTLSSIYKVGNADDKRGMYLIKKTLHKQLAVQTDGYIVLDTGTIKDASNLVGEINPNDLSSVIRIKNWLKLPKLLSLIRNNSITNLTPGDVYSLFQFVRDTSETSSKVVKVNHYQLLDTGKWDQLWQSGMDISEVKKEGIKVFISNASSDPKIPGLATWGSRVIANAGCDVLEAANSIGEFDKSTIVTDDPNLATVKELSRALGIDRIIHPNDLDRTQEHNPQIFRTQVSVILVSQ